MKTLYTLAVFTTLAFSAHAWGYQGPVEDRYTRLEEQTVSTQQSAKTEAAQNERQEDQTSKQQGTHTANP
jgi:hypothetical protein